MIQVGEFTKCLAQAREELEDKWVLHMIFWKANFVFTWMLIIIYIIQHVFL